MSHLRLVGLSGSPRRPSRTTAVVETLGREVGRRRSVAFTSFDLAEMGSGLGATRRDDLPEQAKGLLSAIEAADALIVGTPIYKGSYAGLFKHLIDFIDPPALVGRPVALVATGGGHRHALVIEHHLRPLFGFFSALTMPTGLYAGEEDFVDGALHDPVTLGRLRQLADELAALSSPRFATRAEPTRLERVA